MKYRLLDLLRCPNCGGVLRLTSFRSEATSAVIPDFDAPRCEIHCARHDATPRQVDAQACRDCYRTEITEGKLACTCGETYPIVGGIPRMLPRELRDESLATYHREFLATHGEHFPSAQATFGGNAQKVATLHAFSYQWTTFTRNFEYFREIFLGFVRPFLEPKDFQGKVVLEVGCGSGRPASVAASFGAEVVGMDLSEAVQTAHSMTQHYPLMHVVQADAYAPPFRPGFDFVYSVGVLQHIPNPYEAVKRISSVVQPGHRFVIWVYGVREFWYQPIDWLRRLTVHMPFRMLHALSYVLAVVSEIFLLIPYRILSRLPVTRRLAERIPGRIYARFPFKENVLGWFDRLGAPVTCYFSKPDVQRLLSDAGFEDIRIVSRPDASASWVAEGIKQTSP